RVVLALFAWPLRGDRELGEFLRRGPRPDGAQDRRVACRAGGRGRAASGETEAARGQADSGEADGGRSPLHTERVVNPHVQAPSVMDSAVLALALRGEH